MAQPWYTYRSDTPGSGAYGGIEPQCPGCYDKPDTNIAVPAGTPITALLPGVITDVENLGTNAGGLSVTERLTNAINSAAQYMSFNFLGGTSVTKGQQIAAGQQVGTAGSPTGVNFALGLGSDPVWGGSSFSQHQGVGDPLTNPQTQVLDKLKGGQSLASSSCQCPSGSINVAGWCIGGAGSIATPCVGAQGMQPITPGQVSVQDTAWAKISKIL